MIRKPLRPVLGVLLAGTLAVTAACAGNSNDSSTGAAGSGSGTEPRFGQTMTVAYKSDPKTFDPAVCYDATCWNNMRMMYDRLYDYVGDTMEIEAQAAADMPQVSQDGLTYTVKLRSGMTFTDGKPVTAADVVYSFDRILDPATKSPVASFWTGVKGAADYAKNTATPLTGITAVDDSTVQIQLTAPNSAFKYVLAMPHASIIEKDSASKPIGSGPFVLDHFTPGSEIVVNRNAKYWDSPKPYVDKVVEKLGVDPHVQLLELQKGQIDLMGDPIPAADYLQVSNDASLKAQTKTIVKPSTYYVTMNTKMKPFDNPKVREAVSYAFDRSFLLKLVAGQGEVANEYLPKGITGYTSDKLVHDQDIAKAKQLLTEAGYPNGFETTMYSWNTDPWTALLPQLQQDLGKIGIKVNAQPIQQSAFFELAATPNKAPMTLTFWVADYPDGSDFYQALLSCASAVPGAQNYSFYCNKDVDSLVNQALAASTVDEANKLYTQATTKMLADNPVVPLYYGSKTEVFGKTVGGYHSQPIWGWDMTNYWKTTGTASR
ncbi:peptide/nickel transport system substrate-binding protein/oligopeptide transport system substrate-binding protein [Asanoa ferruginea]|uniref:Peptide/nickel transport system substrate-binding protein/oligopeptide transport system substrate-binding protein n=1 Tax=Asanoa ferruginea TaxID=53367 RepID=A0A3D9ZRZ6_9ACTN|nr:ABC transporter substrate-binding protein [Asanoa ferruginea]REF99907.1 peptide/nickel transport system substrate-binding protein/oligopeptide transport system substrate-binding protein [Asanoa ferruginea]GIF51632.1 peptide ABC transporter substrate-binding protein [Asanoa ferruginea]